MENSKESFVLKHEISTAILVDGGFYRRRAYYFWGDKSPKERADEFIPLAAYIFICLINLI